MVHVESHSHWQGSRQRTWLVPCPDGNGLEVAKKMAEWNRQPERAEDGVTIQENWGLEYASASRVGPVLR